MLNENQHDPFAGLADERQLHPAEYLEPRETESVDNGARIVRAALDALTAWLTLARTAEGVRARLYVMRDQIECTGLTSVKLAKLSGVSRKQIHAIRSEARQRFGL
jgi:hypothetical protein